MKSDIGERSVGFEKGGYFDAPILIVIDDVDRINSWHESKV